jgi:hypothetical protein
MRDSVLWRKQSYIVILLAKRLKIDVDRALDLYYSTETARQLSDATTKLYLMSDQYIVDNIISELNQ